MASSNNRSKIIENRILSVVAHEARNGMPQDELAAFSVQLSGFQDTNARVENYGTSVENLIESGQLVVSESEVVTLPENAEPEIESMTIPDDFKPEHIIEEVFGSFNQTSAIAIIVAPDQAALDLMVNIVTGTPHPMIIEEDPLLIQEAGQFWSPDIRLDMSPNAISAALHPFAVADYDEDSVDD